MRFGDLVGHTSLPIEFVRHRFRNEHVVTVLPVRGNVARQESLLVATSLNLAVVTADADSRSGHWMTRWAPWQSVTLVDDGEVAPATKDGQYSLTVHVGRLTFHARLSGIAGRRAVRDFVVAAQAGYDTQAPFPWVADHVTTGHGRPHSR